MLGNVPAGKQPRITFDDGHASHYRYALRVLEEFGCKATFFVLPGLVGTLPQYMDWSELRVLSDLGHEVQSHGWSHVAFTRCSPKDISREVWDSKRELEDRLGRKVTSISLPFGRYNQQVLDCCELAGYSDVYTSQVGLRTTITRKMRLHGRMMVQSHHGPADVRSLVTRSGACYRTMLLQERVKTPIRKLLGESNYHSLWCKLAGEDGSKKIHQQYGDEIAERSRI
jgi:peptidoglycan/xylan/chitin deacetylase (PgdA/CDA1 family)